MDIAIKNLKANTQALPVLAAWYFNEWGREAGITLEAEQEKLAAALQGGIFPHVLLAMNGSQVVGAAQIKEYEMPEFQSFKHWLGGVFVRAQDRGHGIGQALVTAAQHTAQNMGIETLYLQTENLDGGLYGKSGWEALFVVPKHGTKVLVMKKSLQAVDLEQ